MFILILKKYSSIGLILDFIKKTFIVGMKFKIKEPNLKKKRRQKNNPFVFVFFKKRVFKSRPPFFISRGGKS